MTVEELAIHPADEGNPGEVRLIDGLPPGTPVWWRTFSQNVYHGVIKEWDNGTCIVILPNGKEKAV